MSKLIRREIVPGDKLKTLSDTQRVSRGQFLRATTEGSWGKVQKQTQNLARIRMVYERDENGELDKSKIVKAGYALQYRLGECPRTAIKIIKRRVNDAVRRG